MKSKIKKGAAALILGMLAMGLTACRPSGSDSGNKLIFQIWDQGQKAGMEVNNMATKETP